jgi:glyceraldehyde 3-phosphate dehydrogenase
MALRFGINGLGRVGRALARVAGQRPELQLAAANDVVAAPILARLLARDSVHGPFGSQVAAVAGGLDVDGRFVPIWQEPDPARIDWRSQRVDVVVEATGRFLGRAQAAGHLAAPGGAGHVVLSANPDPGDLADVTVCRGVNDGDLDPARHAVISGASCTTNCLALVAKVLDDSFGLRRGVATVIHSYTESQRLLDGAHADPRRARAAGLNIVPVATTTPAALGLVLPSLAGRIAGLTVRVPTPVVAMLDLVADLRDAPAAAAVRQAFRAASDGALAEVLGAVDDALVSSDFVGEPRSGVVDLPLIEERDGLVRVVAWYDNEWGYANRLADLLVRLATAAAAAALPPPSR